MRAPGRSGTVSHTPAPPLTRAGRSNFLPGAARAYHPWRERSLSVLAGEPFPLAREAALLRALAKPAPGERWLDVGTSTGFYAGVLAQAGSEVLAVDVAPGMLRLAARRYPGERVVWALMDAHALTLPDASLDGVTIGATLNELRDPRRALREAQRVLRPGGRLWLMYVRHTGSPAQRALAALGGLTFPAPGWTRRVLDACDRTAALSVGSVQFQLFEKSAPADRSRRPPG